MATLAHNRGWLTINGIDVRAAAISVEPDRSVELNDTTRGFGTDWTSNAAGLKSAKIKVMLAYTYDNEARLTDQGLTDVGETYRLVYGVEGNAANTPILDQDYILESVPSPKVDVKKTMTVWELSYTHKDAPHVGGDMYAGDKF
ncbi:MAG: hypothetical protein RLP44_02535 [Aggregatilineales bacterium]